MKGSVNFSYPSYFRIEFKQFFFHTLWLLKTDDSPIFEIALKFSTAGQLNLVKFDHSVSHENELVLTMALFVTWIPWIIDPWSSPYYLHTFVCCMSVGAAWWSSLERYALTHWWKHKDISPSAIRKAHPSGWIQEYLFTDWFEHFIKKVPERILLFSWFSEDIIATS